DGTYDLFRFAYSLPLLVIMDMLGAPREDAAMLRALGDRVSATNSVNPVPPETARQTHAAMTEFREYVLRLAERNRDAPRPGSLRGAITHAEEADRLTDDDVVGLYMIFLFAGHETTMNLILNGVRALLAHREQWELLRSDPSLAGSAVEEVLRFDSPAQFFP